MTTTTKTTKTAAKATPATKAKTTAKPKKTKLARATAVAILKKSGKPMTGAELVAKVLATKAVKDAGIPKGTVSAQISFEVNEAEPKIIRVDRAVYRHVDTPVEIGIPQ